MIDAPRPEDDLVGRNVVGHTNRIAYGQTAVLALRNASLRDALLVGCECTNTALN
jgi:hypothetical protein